MQSSCAAHQHHRQRVGCVHAMHCGLFTTLCNVANDALRCKRRLQACSRHEAASPNEVCDQADAVGTAPPEQLLDL